MATILTDTSNILTPDNLIGRDLEINFRRNGTLYRGPIQFASRVKEDQKYGNPIEFIILELEWLAVRYSPSRLPLYATSTQGPWSRYDNAEMLQQKISVNYFRPMLSNIGVEFQEAGHAMRFANIGDNLDLATVYTEYHIAARIAHSLYPPQPFEDMLCVGTVENISPADTAAQEEVGVTEVTFVVFAKSFEGACGWVRGECARLALPIISLTETQLKPGL